jgi:CubicO group peptidase (beta-lactamase class C family)
MKVLPVVLPLVLASMCTLSSFAQSPAPRMEEIVQSYVDAKDFIGSVLVVKDQSILLNRGYGYADAEWKIPNAPTTKFRLGSATKQFTAAAIMLLVERGRLNLDEPIKSYMPDAPATWDKVTIRLLLTHQAGIPNFTGFPDYAQTKWKDTTPEALVARFRDKPLDFVPGSRFSYSNSGYALLGYLLERVSGQAYSTFLKSNIFEPLGMSDTGMDDNALILPQRASGYVRRGEQLRNADYLSMTAPYAAGALYSTTVDLLKWERGLFGGKILSPASLNLMTKPVTAGYGFGLFALTRYGNRVFYHSGDIDGFNTMLAYYPDEKLTGVVLGNMNSGAPEEIAEYLGRIALGQHVITDKERKTVLLEPANLADYVGAYRTATGLTLVITDTGGHLSLQLSNGVRSGPQFAMTPESQSVFYVKELHSEVEFRHAPDGSLQVTSSERGHDDLLGTKVSDSHRQ